MALPEGADDEVRRGRREDQPDPGGRRQQQATFQQVTRFDHPLRRGAWIIGSD